jgi:SAM-dependent methyltransferase
MWEAARLTRHRNDWNALARIDPLFAIRADKGKRGGGWTLDDFLATGREEIDSVVAYLKDRGPDLRFEVALDFGCGVGRLTAPLGKYWRSVVGVDISEEMIALAERYHGALPGVRFVHNDRADLALFGDGTFDFVYSNITLMHIPHEPTIQRYVQDFVRVLRPGGYALFQLPTRLPLFQRIKLRRALYHVAAGAGLRPEFLYNRLHLHPVKMMQVPRWRLESWVSPGAQVVDVVNDGREETRYLIRKG